MFDATSNSNGMKLYSSVMVVNTVHFILIKCVVLITVLSFFCRNFVIRTNGLKYKNVHFLFFIAQTYTLGINFIKYLGPFSNYY